uniref:Ig-like domain-containing protein n=1 Tax=Monopterus albus TaxID=43700 RepID=A0A3Q3J7X6_MONAL
MLHALLPFHLVSCTHSISTFLLSIIMLNTSSFSASVPEFIRAEPGDNVTLACRAPSYTDIRAVVWSRPDLEPRVILYQKRMSDPEHQHLSFQDRVELEDNEMKDGDVSLVLRNVTTGDSGTYECRNARDLSSFVRHFIITLLAELYLTS